MVFAQINNNTIINIISLIDSSLIPFFSEGFDYFIQIDNIIPQPLIGWSFDGQNFTNPNLPNDIYGYSVTFSTDKITDIYKNALGIVVSVPSGTSQKAVYLSLAIQDNIYLLTPQAESFVQSRYSDSVRLNLIGLFLNAQLNNFTNRIAYLSPLLIWQNSIIAYIGQYCSNVKKQTTPEAVLTFIPNFNQFIITDPLLTPIVAIQIQN